MTSKKSKRSSRKEPEISREATILLSSEELAFLRDLFGLITPAGEGGESTVSELLADVTQRQDVELSAWSKVAEACAQLDVIVGDGAPTFALSAASVPSMHVYEVT